MVVEAEDADKQQMGYRAPRNKDHLAPLLAVRRLGSMVTLRSPWGLEVIISHMNLK